MNEFFVDRVEQFSTNYYERHWLVFTCLRLPDYWWCDTLTRYISWQKLSKAKVGQNAWWISIAGACCKHLDSSESMSFDAAITAKQKCQNACKNVGVKKFE